jgi:hypothetical protein
MNHRSWIVVSGFVWFFMGVFLLYKGLQLITQATFQTSSLCSHFQDPQQAATILIALGLMIGFLKARFVLVKSVRRVVTRILSLSLPIRFKNVYSTSYWILIGGMMCLGMIFRFLPIPVDIRGWIDVTIGSALVNGAMLYFRMSKSLSPRSP